MYYHFLVLKKSWNTFGEMLELIRENDYQIHLRFDENGELVHNFTTNYLFDFRKYRFEPKYNWLPEELSGYNVNHILLPEILFYQMKDTIYVIDDDSVSGGDARTLEEKIKETKNDYEDDMYDQFMEYITF